MPIPDRRTYLAATINELRTHWPENRVVNVVCHGHSVPAGYLMTPLVDTFNAYPHLLHLGLKHRFPFAPINVIVTAIGGENSESGAARFEAEVLTHRPDVVTIDYGLNDRRIGLDAAKGHWTRMIEQAKAYGAKVILLTPTHDMTQDDGVAGGDRQPLVDHADQIRQLAEDHNVALVDSHLIWDRYRHDGGDLTDLLSQVNHPNRQGHELVAEALLRWFPPVVTSG